MDTSNKAQNNPVLLFDGVCNLCESSVQWIIRRDKKQLFRFASLQSDYAHSLLRAAELPEHWTDSVVLVHNGRFYAYSDAAIQTLILLGGFWRLAACAYLIPRFIRNAIYRYVARNRYRWFGQKDACMIPTPELKARFLG